MSKSQKRKKRVEEEILKLEIKKRNGFIRMICAIAAFCVIAIFKTVALNEGLEWANNPYLNGAIFMAAVVAAGVAGLGSRAWWMARKRLSELEGA